MATNSDMPKKPWSWRCHKCHRPYPMACTQRCIGCSHTICFSDRDTVQTYCRITFDLPGWQDFCNRRRSELLQQRIPSNQQEQTTAADEVPEQHAEEALAGDANHEEAERLDKMVNGTSNCFTDCRFPSECFITMALNSISKPFNQPSSSSPSQPTKTPREAKRYKRRGRKNFQKVPSPLSQEWHIDTVSDDEVNRDAIKSQQERVKEEQC